MRSVRPLEQALVLAVLSCLPAGCGPGAVGEAVRPKEATAAQALQEGECRDVSTGGEPLVVDWKSEQREHLEVAMREGVAIVAYSCKGIKLLTECHAGDKDPYGFMGTTRREQVVQLRNADEVSANLPLSGATIGGGMARDASLDIAMVMVGQKKTTQKELTMEDLKGDKACEGATHFVRGATVGAFALETGTSGKVRAAVEIFGASAGGASSSERNVKNHDGDLSDCKKASPSSEKAPDQCGAPIRLVLLPIAKKQAEPAEAPAEGEELAKAEGGCPKGMVLAEGKCTTPDAAPAYQCKADDEKECAAQCDKGHAGSCGALGALLVRGDAGKAAGLFKKGCDGRDAKSCVNLGMLTEGGVGTSKDPAAAATLFEKGCNDGEAIGCGRLGRAYLAGTGVAADPAKAATLLDKGCDGGDDKSCGAVAVLYAEGKGVQKDAKRAAELYRRACNGSDAASCVALGEMYEVGAGIGKNPIIAGMMYQRGCIRANGDACAGQGRIEMAKPNGGNADEAKRHFDRACTWRSEVGCAVMKAVYGQNRPVIPSPQKTQALRKSCDTGNAKDCTALGILTVASGNKPGGMIDIQRACTRGDAWACEVQKKIK